MANFGYWSMVPGIMRGAGEDLPEGAMTSQDVPGLAYKIERHPVMAVLGEDQAIACPGRFALVRGGTDVVTAVVGDRYRTVQNEVAFAGPDALARAGLLKYERWGHIRNGGVAFLTAKVASSQVTRLNGVADPVEHYAMFMAGHDGHIGVGGLLSTNRLHCSNQIPSLKAKGLVYSVRHTSGAEARLEAAQSMLMDLQADAAEQTTQLQRMASTPLSRDGFRTIAEELLDEVRGAMSIDETDDAQKARARRSETVDELVSFFDHGIGNDGRSLWDGFNSVTEWLDHRHARRDRATAETASRQLYGSLFGPDSDTKRRAAKLLLRRAR
jgi:phage/plasmid-like protein (TIGR03299 family)